MDVREFVTESLRQIVEGAKEVQSEVADKAQMTRISNQLERVEFDIGVTVDEEKTREKGAGLAVYCIEANGWQPQAQYPLMRAQAWGWH